MTHTVPFNRCEHVDPTDGRCQLAIGHPAQFDHYGERKMIDHPPHYLGHPSGLEAIEVTRGLTFCVGNAVKYVWRSTKKNGQQDYGKAAWYLDDAVRHADAVYATTTPLQTAQRLDVVARSETNPYRVQFFTAVRDGRLHDAREAVTALLD